MTVSLLKPIALAALLGASFIYVPFATARPASPQIDAITCPAGDEKFVMTLGVDDRFRGGQEAARPRLELELHPTIQNFQTTHSLTTTKQYDERTQNSYFVDSFRDVPRPISQGHFITRLNVGGSNDAIYLGKGDKIWDPIVGQQHNYGVQITTAAPAWTVTGNVYSLDLSTVQLRSGAGTLLDFVNGDVSGSSAREFDVVMQDDTAIDFATLVLCRRAH